MTTLNVTGVLERLIAHIVASSTDFSHIDPSRLLVCVATTRNGYAHGTYAKIHPLRFQGGGKTLEVTRRRRTVLWEMPAISHRGKDILYVIYFLTPRFFDLPLREKLITVFHELYHISPAFDGDIRRFPGRNYAHGGSTKHYNARMARLVDDYLAALDTPHIISPLEGDMSAIRGRHAVLVGRKMETPKVRPVGNLNHR